MMDEKRFTISNLLSFSRIFLIAPIGYCVTASFPNHRWWAAGLILVAIATDYFDGYFARKLHQVTELGKFIDPLADKIAIGLYAILMVWTGDVPLWFVIFVLARDVVIFFGGIYINKTKGIIPQSNWPGKVAVTCIAIVFFLGTLELPVLEPIQGFAVNMSVLMMIWSLLSYGQRLFIGRKAGL